MVLQSNMRDIDRAKSGLSRANLVVCNGERELALPARGIGPLLEICESGEDWRGASAADCIVGKAAALLFASLRVAEVYGAVMSRGAIDVFEAYSIVHSCGTECEYIINRSGTGMCPMECAVAQIDDPQEAVAVLRRTMDALARENAKGGNEV